MKRCTNCGCVVEDDADVCRLCKGTIFKQIDNIVDKTIIDEQKNWRAVIEDLGDTLVLYFITKPSEIPIQGEVDEALEEIYGWETKIGIGNLEMTMDDGSYSVYYGDYPKAQYAELRPKIKEYLTKIYTENKKRFVKCIKADLKEYGEL